MYYYLFEQIDNTWHYAFGDFDRDVVKDEAAEMDNKTYIYRALVTADVQAMADALNSEGKL